MSNKPVETFMEALKMLNPELGAEYEEPIGKAWVQAFRPIPDADVLATLKGERTRTVNGVLVRAVPYFFTESLCEAIDREWSTLPMYSRDFIIQKATGQDTEQGASAEANRCLKETIQRILEREKTNEVRTES